MKFDVVLSVYLCIVRNLQLMLKPAAFSAELYRFAACSIIM